MVVDNESDDDSVNIARNAGARIITMKRNEFTYGRALNRGIASCTGEFILVLSSHIILLNEFFLDKIPGYFKDEQVAALRFVQANSPSCVRESCITGPQKIIFNTEPDFAVKNWNRLMINHCAAFRQSCWEMLAFEEILPDGEDKKWILEMMKQGFAMLYNVPCFYVYSKEIIREKKIRAAIRDHHGKFLITGTTEPLYKSSYIMSMTKMLMTELRKLKTQLSIHSGVFKGVKSLQKKNQGK